MSGPKRGVAAKCDPETVERIERAADELGVTKSEFVADILEAYVQQNPDHIEALQPDDVLTSVESFTKVYL